MSDANHGAIETPFPGQAGNGRGRMFAGREAWANHNCGWRSDRLLRPPRAPIWFSTPPQGIGGTIDWSSGVRAAACIDLYSARLCRQHNDANVLALGSRIVAPPLAEALAEVFLTTTFEGGRHARRVAKLDGEPA